MKNPFKKPLCIYHANCSDGFGAACIVNKAIPDGVELYPASHGDAPPDVTGRNVVMVDFSYPRQEITAMAKKCEYMLILDHHKTAETALKGIFEDDKIDGMFDMERSGCMMAWEWFFPDQKAPALVEHIQDRDLWRFHLQGTDAVMAAVFSYPQNIGTWSVLMRPDALDGLNRDGAAILRAHNKNIKDVTNIPTRRMKFQGYDVPVANVPFYMASDVGNALSLDEFFAGTYYDSLEGRHFSLRSQSGGADVSQIAEEYGGGGHEHAAGFLAKFDVLPENGWL